MRRTRFLTGLLSVPILAMLATSAAGQTWMIVPWSDYSVFIPHGYDTNDPVIDLGVDGYFPSDCYRIVKPKVTYDRPSKKMHIEVLAQQRLATQAEPCTKMRVPFSQIIQLDRLPTEGTYDVLFNSKKASTRDLEIVASVSASTDNERYAPVDSVSVDYDKFRDVYVATLRGRNLPGCLEWGKEDFPAQRTDNTIVLRPILQEAAVCGPDQARFTRGIDLPQLAPGRYLLHVRSLGGTSVNHFFDVY